MKARKRNGDVSRIDLNKRKIDTAKRDVTLVKRNGVLAKGEAMVAAVMEKVKKTAL